MPYACACACACASRASLRQHACARASPGRCTVRARRHPRQHVINMFARAQTRMTPMEYSLSGAKEKGMPAVSQSSLTPMP